MLFLTRRCPVQGATKVRPRFLLSEKTPAEDPRLYSLTLSIAPVSLRVLVNTGIFLKALNEGVGEGGSVFGVEISSGFLKMLREKVDAEGLSRVTLIEGSVNRQGLSVLLLIPPSKRPF
jgi:hypothetical protein